MQLAFGVILLALIAGVKLGAMLEIPPLYHALLFLPAKFTELITGSSYTEQAGTYLFPGFILDYSCAGVNFLLVCLCAGGWLLAQRIHSLPAIAQTLALLLSASWLVTNIANGFRIGLSLKLFFLSTGHAWLHEAVGTMVFVTFLVLYYEILKRLRYG